VRGLEQIGREVDDRSDQQPAGAASLRREHAGVGVLLAYKVAAAVDEVVERVHLLE
jgi:hypothetical protein